MPTNSAQSMVRQPDGSPNEASMHRQRRLPLVLMLLAVVPLALGCWRLYVWQCGQVGEFARYQPPPLRADWDRASGRYEALVQRVHQNSQQPDQDDVKTLRNMETIRERLALDEEAKLA